MSLTMSIKTRCLSCLNKNMANEAIDSELFVLSVAASTATMSCLGRKE